MAGMLRCSLSVFATSLGYQVVNAAARLSRHCAGNRQPVSSITDPTGMMTAWEIVMQERRRCVRTRTLKSARIIIDPKTSALECIVRNLSPSGALLLVTSLAVPDRFDLILSATR